MTKEKKIYQYSFLYHILSRITFFFMRIYYRRIYIRGQENVVPGMPVIFAPNHKNALMDTLLILLAFPKHQVVFMAVSYIFTGNKVLDKFLRFLKILPVYRAREGVEDLGKNEQPFREAVETLKENKKLCLMPEGQQVEIRRLLPLVKGMFRIGLYAQEKFGSAEGVKIIPTGIEYEDLRRSGRNVLIQFGEPLELADYYELYAGNPPKAYGAIRKELYPKISSLMLNVNSQKHYQSIYLAVILQVDAYIKENNLPRDEWSRLEAKQKIAEKYLEQEKLNPEKLDALDKEMQKLLDSGKSDDEISRLVKKVRITDAAAMVVLLPVFIPGAVCMLLPYIIIKAIAGIFRTSGFYSTLSFLLGIIVPALFFTLYFLISLFFMPALWSALIFLLIVPLLSILSFKLKNLYFDNIQRIRFQAAGWG